MIDIRTDFSAPQFDLEPAAPHTGPFTTRELMRAWWELRAPPGSRLQLAISETGLLPLWEGPGGVQFLGEEDLVDYHSPLGSGIPELVAAHFEALPPGTAYRLDSLPVEAARPVAEGLSRLGLEAEPIEHEVAAAVDMPADYDEYLELIGKKERHEVRRKRRRFERLLGEPVIAPSRDEEALHDFVRMHRMSPGPKGEFMTAEMAEFFAAVLAAVPEARIDLLTAGGDGKAVAAAFGFASQGAYYLYNSAYDPGASDASPGIVLLGGLLESFAVAGGGRFDFLKGDEAYKFRLGAQARPLYVIEGRR